MALAWTDSVDAFGGGPRTYVWDLNEGEEVEVPDRESADALLRTLYPPAEPATDDEAEVARDVMDLLRNPPPPSPAMVEAIRDASAIRRVDGSVTRAEFSEVAADVAFLTSGLLEDKQHLNRALDVVIRLQDQVAALVEHVATLEERTRPLGPVAPPIGDHVEALKERKAVVAWLREYVDQIPVDSDEESDRIEAAIITYLADRIGLGEHRKATPSPPARGGSATPTAQHAVSWLARRGGSRRSSATVRRKFGTTRPESGNRAAIVWTRIGGSGICTARSPDEHGDL